jgi:hypothetical protein
MADDAVEVMEAISVLCDELEEEGISPEVLVDALLTVGFRNALRLSDREDLALWLERAAAQIRAGGTGVGGVN